MTSRPIRRAQLIAVALLAAVLFVSFLAVRADPGRALLAGLIDGLAVGIALGVTRLVPSYDEAWDEFGEATLVTYLFGFFALLYYALRGERPSAFFVVEAAAGTLSYAMLAFVPLLTWIQADLLLFAGTFGGWLLSGIFRPVCE